MAGPCKLLRAASPHSSGGGAVNAAVLNHFCTVRWLGGSDPFPGPMISARDVAALLSACL